MRKSFIVAGLLAAGAAAPAMAQQGWYAGIGVGSAHARFDSSDFDATGVLNEAAVAAALSPSFTQSTSFDNRDTGWKIFGGYMFTPNWGAELSYTGLGKYDISGEVSFAGVSVANFSTDYKVESWNLAGVGRLPLAQNFNLQAKLGAAFTRAKRGEVTISIPSIPFTDSIPEAKKSRTNLLWGVGAGYDFNKNMGVLVEYENFGKVGSSTGNTDSNETGRAKIDMWSASLVYRF